MLAPPSKGRSRGQSRTRRHKAKGRQLLTRAPPLPVSENSDVTVVNGDRSNLSWKRYTLLKIDAQTGICTVIGADKVELQFPRAVVKPKDWILKLRDFFKLLGKQVDFYSFATALQLLGGQYNDITTMKIFKSLDVHASGLVEFQHFMNWMYGLGRHADRAKLLTTLECVSGARKWDQDKELRQQSNNKTSLPFYTLLKKVIPIENYDNRGGNGSKGSGNDSGPEVVYQKSHAPHSPTDDDSPYLRQHKTKFDWQLSEINWDQSTNENIALMKENEYGKHKSNKIDFVTNIEGSKNDNDIDSDGDEKEISHTNDSDGDMYKQVTDRSTIIMIPKNIKEFKKQFEEKLAERKAKFDTKFRPTSQDEDYCSIVVMGPGETGKSAMLNKFVKGIFPHEYDPTITDNYKKSFQVNNKTIVLDITDTAGQEEFASMRYDWLKDSVDVLITTFTRASKISFIQWKSQLRIAQRLLHETVRPKLDNIDQEWRIQPRHVPIVAVGTKSDLYEDEFEVTTEEVYDVIHQLGGVEQIKYLECSAFADDTDKNRVDRIFIQAVESYRKARSKNQTPLKLDHEASQLIRRDTLAREFEPTKSEKIKVALMDCVYGCTSICPNLQKYVKVDDNINRRLLIIGRVPKDKFPDDIAPPQFSTRHFMVRRRCDCSIFFGGILMAFLFPIVLFIQTLCFVFYYEGSLFTWISRLLPEWDYGDPQIAVMFDFLHPIVGRDPRDESVKDDAREGFCSQKCTQRLVRLIISPIVIALFFFAFYNGFSIYFLRGSYKIYLSEGYDDKNRDLQISIMEYMGPLMLWFLTWFILSLYMALDIEILPNVPNMQELRPFVMYLGEGESIRTTAYVFLRGFAKSTLEIYRLEATWDRLLISFLVSVIYALIPGVTREFIDDGFWTSDGHFVEALAALIINLSLVFVLSLCVQMQLLSGLQNYVEWMDDVTSLLDPEFAELRDLPYLSLARQSNAIAWVEMRTYLYTKGLIIFSRQEIFVSSLIAIDFCIAAYLLYRLLTDDSAVIKSETFNGLFFGFIVMCGLLLSLLRTVKIVERLQEKQESLIANQKLKVYYERITYHPPKDELSEGGIDDDIFAGLDDIPEIPSDDDIPDSESDQLRVGGIGGQIGSDSDDDIGIVTETKDDDNIKGKETNGFGNTIGNLLDTEFFGYGEDAIKNQEYAEGGIAMLSIQNELYLANSETLLKDIESLLKAQDIIPRVCNMHLVKVVGLSVLAVLFAVVPTAIRSAGQDTSDYSLGYNVTANGTNVFINFS